MVPGYPYLQLLPRASGKDNNVDINAKDWVRSSFYVFYILTNIYNKNSIHAKAFVRTDYALLIFIMPAHSINVIATSLMWDATFIKHGCVIPLSFALGRISAYVWSHEVPDPFSNLMIVIKPKLCF